MRELVRHFLASRAAGGLDTLPTFVISLHAATHRRAALLRHAAAGGLRLGYWGGGAGGGACTGAGASCGASGGSSDHPGEVHWMPGVRGALLGSSTLKAVLRPQTHTAYHLGQVGCFLSHVTVWREVVERGLPFAVVLEDDAQLAPGGRFRRMVAAAVARLSEEAARSRGGAAAGGWDVLFLNYGDVPAETGDMRTRKWKSHEACLAALTRAGGRQKPFRRRRAPRGGTGGGGGGGAGGGGGGAWPAPIVALDACFHLSSAAYVVSQRGAATLLKHFFPVPPLNIDVALFQAQSRGLIRAFALVPHVARPAVHGGDRNQTQMAPRFAVFKPGGGLFVSFAPGDQPDCARTDCTLAFSSDIPYISGATLQI